MVAALQKSEKCNAEGGQPVWLEAEMATMDVPVPAVSAGWRAHVQDRGIAWMEVAMIRRLRPCLGTPDHRCLDLTRDSGRCETCLAWPV